MKDMSRKRVRRQLKKRRHGRRTDPRQIVITAVCAVAVCTVIVLAIFYGAVRLIDRSDADGSVSVGQDEGMEPVRETKQEKETEQGKEQEQEEKVEVEREQKKEEETGEQTLPEEAESAVVSVSILGDSISTFRDYIPAGYYDFFPENGLVQDVNDTWWKRVMDETGWTLYVNGSSSGATCTGDSTGTDNPQCGCNEFRIGALYGPGGAAPDIIIVYMGTNDLLESIPMGDNDGTRQVAEGQVSTFGDAYTLMVDKLRARYPSSQIYCCTIAQVGTYGTSTPYVEFVNGEGLTAADYSARITQIAENKNLPVIDLYSCGITVDNLHNTSADGVHPTPDGMAYIADAVREVLDKYGE